MKKTNSTIALGVLLSAICLIGCPQNDGVSSDPENSNQGSATIYQNRTADGLKVVRLPLRSRGPVTLDPARTTEFDEKQCVAQIYEPLLQYSYRERPLQLEPLLLESMVTISDDRKAYTFRLKKGIHFQDDPCFEQGKGREVTVDDVFYSWKRLADPDVGLENWWLFEGLIVGLDEYRNQLLQIKTDKPEVMFDYAADIEGMQKLGEYQFRIELKKAHPRFYWMLAMPQLAIVPREAVERYGDQFSFHPVGTGPYLLANSEWRNENKMVMIRNPNYWEVNSDRHGPMIDRIETIFYDDNQTMWMEFRSRKIAYTTVPGQAYFDESFDYQTKAMKPEFSNMGITHQNVPVRDFIFYGFNMEDTFFGGYTDKQRNLRQAIALAIDWDQKNETFYDGLCTVFDGMIPPGFEGYPEDGKIRGAYRGPDLERARELIAKAGFPDGNRLPTLDHFLTDSGSSSAMAAMTENHLAEIGVEVETQLLSFDSFVELMDRRESTFFYFSWISDYPDAENNLSLFYGPNSSPGKNYFNYQNDEFDRLYESTLKMKPGPERTAVYEKLRNMIIRDCPYAGSLARNRRYLVHQDLKNFYATEDFFNWYKYLDVE